MSKVMKRDRVVPTRISLKLKLISIRIVAFDSTPHKDVCQQGQGGQSVSETRDHVVLTHLTFCIYATLL